MNDRRYRTLRRQRDILLICLIISLIAFALLYVRQQVQPPSFQTSIQKSLSHMTPVTNTHIIGGFSANTADKIINAAGDGIQTIFYYGNPPDEDSVLGQQLQALHMKIVDGFISSNLHYYECQKARAMLFPPSGLNSYCGQASTPTFASEDAFLASIADHVKQSHANPLIIGYWVLDDWPSWDAGGARQLLMEIHEILQQYTPARPAICGFGASQIPHSVSGWSSWLADNFSPQGCDAVGLYVYSGSQCTTIPLPSPAAYDWSMSSLLPAIFANLRQRGWNIAREPLIGIAQAFGGPIAHTNKYQVTPTAADIELQSRSFCQHGATGLTFYGWSDSGFGPSTQTPMNSSTIKTGIRNGITACTQYWNKH